MHSFRFRRLLIAAVLVIAVGRMFATTPTVAQSIPAQALAPGGVSLSIDLRDHFTLPGVSGQIVQFDTVLGKFNVELLSQAAPLHVANFLAYAESNAYVNSFFHRSAALNVGGANRIVQGGGYRAPIPVTTIPKLPAVALEYNLPNARGTFAAARGPELNSATSEWFFNIDDNSAVLGPANNGGYSVFGRVLGTGMSVMDAIAALSVTSGGGAFTSLPVRNYSGGNFVDANLAVVNSIVPIPLFPTGGGTSAIAFSGQNTASSIVNGTIAGSTLTITPLAAGSGAIMVRGADTNGNFAEIAFAVDVSPGPVFTAQPESRTAAPGDTVILTVAAAGATSYQWQRNGVDIVGATAPTLTLSNVQPGDAGFYVARASDGAAPRRSEPAVVGLAIGAKLVGVGTEFPDLPHPNGNIFDQILLGGSAASVTADPGQVLRMSYLDANDDIVQVEFSGAGTLTLVLEASSGPATPTRYTQPAVSYMKGHATIVITGANETTNVGVFSVGRATAFDPTGTYNILLPAGPTNVPAGNQSPLFAGHAGTVYDGLADIAAIAILSTDGRFAGLRCANTRFSANRGWTGVQAPGVTFVGPMFVGDVEAMGEATPVLLLGGGSDTRVTGGDLGQGNAQPVQVSGISQLRFTAGGDSHGNTLSPKANQALLLQNGINVTGAVVQ